MRLSGHGCGDIGASLERLVCWCECCRGLDMWYNVRQGGWEVAEAVLSQNSDHSEAGKLGGWSELEWYYVRVKSWAGAQATV